MALNIGEKIKQRAKELRIGPTELGKMIDTSKQNVYGIYKRKSVDTELLRKISKALNWNFFQYYIAETAAYPSPGSQDTTPPPYGKKNRHGGITDEIAKLRKELEDLREKYEMLKKINALLEKQKGK